MRVPVLLTLVAAHALPAVAGAEEVSAVDVCGTDGCTRIADRAALRSFQQGSELAAAAPAGRQRSYLLGVRVRDEAGGSQLGWTSRWLPAARVAEVVPAPPARASDSGASGPPALAWTGPATVVLLAAGV